MECVFRNSVPLTRHRSLLTAHVVWSWRRDLNPRPSDYKSDALPTELRQQNLICTPNPLSRKLLCLQQEGIRDTGQEVKVSTTAYHVQANATLASMLIGHSYQNV